MNFKKITAYFFTMAILVTSLSFYSFAVSSDTYEILNDNQGRVMSIAYRGDSEFYPENSIEGIKSAIKKGADFVSVSVQKTKDNEFILCDDDDLNHIFKTEYKDIKDLTFDEIKDLKYLDSGAQETKYKVARLEKAISKLDGAMLIVDNTWEFNQELYIYLSENGWLDEVIFRFDKNASDITNWFGTLEEKPLVIGVNGSPIVMSVISHFNELSELGMPAVQFQSKNHFNLMYRDFVAKRYSEGEGARAIAPMYEVDKCGQRPDSQRGWDELISLGFSVIETNNIEQFQNYIESSDELSEEISSLIAEAKNINLDNYSQASQDKLLSTIEDGEKIQINSSLEEKQGYKSLLISSINNLVFGTKEDTQVGSLNISTTKIIAVVIMGALIFIVQVYIYKMKDKKGKQQNKTQK